MRPLCSPGEYCVWIMAGAVAVAVISVVVAKIEDRRTARKDHAREYDEHLARQIDQEF